jgi:hypothetical protein
MSRIKSLTAALALAGGAFLSQPGAAQFGPRTPPPANAQVGAPVDLTGQWVSIVTEDWRWRMITPPKGDYASVPLTPAGTALADKWDLNADNAAGQQCKAYGVGGLVRIPSRIRLSWADPNTLKFESDAGQQTRLFHFISTEPGNVLPALSVAEPGAATLQGYSKAQWFKQVQSRGLGFGGAAGKGGAMRAITRNMTAGYLRKNGVPYSADAVVTEQYNVFKHDNGDTWLTVTTIVDDPQNLRQPFITSTQFKKEADRSKWSAAPCRTDPPLEPPVQKPARG